jgi:hypothetical protein
VLRAFDERSGMAQRVVPLDDRQLRPSGMRSDLKYVTVITVQKN